MSLNIGVTGDAKIISRGKGFTIVEMVNPLDRSTLLVKLRNH